MVVSVTCDILTYHPLIFVKIQVISSVLGLGLITVTVLRLVRILFSSSSLIRHFDIKEEKSSGTRDGNFLSPRTHPINTRHWYGGVTPLNTLTAADGRGIAAPNGVSQRHIVNTWHWTQDSYRLHRNLELGTIIRSFKLLSQNWV